MKIEANTIDEFFENSGAYKESLIFLDKFIQEHLPNLERKLRVTDTMCMLGYGDIPYHTKSCGDSIISIISLAPQKNNISMYVMAWKDGKSLAKTYEGKLGKTSNGEGCIRFKKFENLDLEQLKNLLKDVNDVYKYIKSKQN